MTSESVAGLKTGGFESNRNEHDVRVKPKPKLAPYFIGLVNSNG